MVNIYESVSHASTCTALGVGTLLQPVSHIDVGLSKLSKDLQRD